MVVLKQNVVVPKIYLGDMYEVGGSCALENDGLFT